VGKSRGNRDSGRSKEDIGRGAGRDGCVSLAPRVAQPRAAVRTSGSMPMERAKMPSGIDPAAVCRVLAMALPVAVVERAKAGGAFLEALQRNCSGVSAMRVARMCDNTAVPPSQEWRCTLWSTLFL
jgi:hypothetical protein